MSPEQFQHSAAAWIQAIGSLIIPLGTLVGAVCGFISLTKSRLNETRINAHSQTLKEVLRDMPPPGSSLPPAAQVSIDNGPGGTSNVTNDAASVAAPVSDDPTVNTAASVGPPDMPVTAETVQSIRAPSDGGTP